jgi:hypothetical protein
MRKRRFTTYAGRWETVDFTEFIKKDTVMHNGYDMANVRWKYDDYFRRDGRNIGSCNWFTIGSDWCRDLWHPLDDITFEQAIQNIKPIPHELNTLITREHLIDDYLLSRNIAKYGLKFTCVNDLLPTIRLQGSNFFWHEYTIPIYHKVRKMKDILRQWQLDKIRSIYYQPLPEIEGWMTHPELQWLADNAAEMETVVEVGSWKGRSTHALATACKGKVFCVDNFKGSQGETDTTHREAVKGDVKRAFDKNTARFENIEVLHMDSMEAVKKFEPKSIDMVFIDGDHCPEAAMRDLIAWAPVAKKLFCGHDYPLIAGELEKAGKVPLIECESIWSVEI